MTGQVISIDQHEAVIAAEATLAPLRARREGLEREHAETHRLVGYTNVLTHEATVSASPEDIARARLRRPEVERELQELRIAEMLAERQFAEARRAAKAEAHAAVDVERRRLVARLDKALAAAAAISAELVPLDTEAQRLSDNRAEAAAWPELAEETPTYQSRVSCWRRSMQAAGLMD